MPAITIPGTAGIVERKKAQLATAVEWHWNMATDPLDKQIRPPSAGDLGTRLQTERLG
jgi:hypothetical protein